MRDRTWILTVAVAGALAASACGGAAAQTPPATTAAAVATLAAPSTTTATLPPPTTAAATLPPATTAAATPTSAATSSASGGGTTPSASLVADGKVVFTTIGPSGKGCQECHGADGKGSTATDGTTAPNIRGATEQKLRDALRGGAALMTNLKLTDAQITAVLAYLTYLDQQ